MEGWFSTSFIEVIRLDNPIQYFQEGKVVHIKYCPLHLVLRGLERMISIGLFIPPTRGSQGILDACT